MTSSLAVGQDRQAIGYVSVDYDSGIVQAEQILEDTRTRLMDMVERRGGNPQINLLTGDMVRNWKSAKQAFDSGDYAESIRICKVVQKFIY